MSRIGILARLLAPFAFVRRPAADERLSELKRDLRARQEQVVEDYRRKTKGARFSDKGSPGETDKTVQRMVAQRKMRINADEYRHASRHLPQHSGTMKA